MLGPLYMGTIFQRLKMGAFSAHVAFFWLFRAASLSIPNFNDFFSILEWFWEVFGRFLEAKNHSKMTFLEYFFELRFRMDFSHNFCYFSKARVLKNSGFTAVKPHFLQNRPFAAFTEKAFKNDAF